MVEIYDNGDTSEELNEISYLESQLYKIYDYNDQLWYNIMVPYITNTQSSQILTKMTDSTKSKEHFCNLMLNKNPTYAYLVNHIAFLKKNL
jgi:hypothetical protein